MPSSRPSQESVKQMIDYAEVRIETLVKQRNTIFIPAYVKNWNRAKARQVYGGQLDKFAELDHEITCWNMTRECLTKLFKSELERGF